MFRSIPDGMAAALHSRPREAKVKRLIPVIVIGSLLVVGCAKSKKPEAQPVEPSLTEYTPPPAPAPEPTYTPAPQPGPVITPAPAPAPVKTAPTVKTAPAPVKTPVKTTSTKTYVVKPGDTLSEIAKANKTTSERIMALNPTIKKADMIYAGQKLKMP